MASAAKTPARWVNELDVLCAPRPCSVSFRRLKQSLQDQHTKKS